MKVKISAPGKLMLLGEHAVVYGFPCIVTAVDMRVNVVIRSNHTNSIAIETPLTRTKGNRIVFPLSQLGEARVSNITSFVIATLRRFSKLCDIPNGIDIMTFGPDKSYGLGSSSAVTVALAFALAHFHQAELGPYELFKLCHSAVIDVQGEASGFDIASAIFGGTIFYDKRGETIIPLNIDSLPIVIGYSGTKASTIDLVTKVGELYSRKRKHITEIFDLIGHLVNDARESIINEDWQDFGELLNINHGLLESLGVGSHSLARPIYAARESGAFGAKLSGAGGGDCMFAVTSSEVLGQVKTAIEVSGAEVITFTPNAPGVRIEEI